MLAWPTVTLLLLLPILVCASYTKVDDKGPNAKNQVDLSTVLGKIHARVLQTD